MDEKRSFNKVKHISGLGSIRFILASIVIFSHGFGLHISDVFCKEEIISSFGGKLLWVVSANLYNGQAAVIVFFIISGCCIHYPYANGESVHIYSFLASRYIRISLPLIIVLLAGYTVFNIEPLAYIGVWSIICELIYYSIYPLLLTIRKRCHSWITLYMGSLLGVILIVVFVNVPPVSHPGILMDFPIYGPKLTWLIGLPIWILGCHLAESIISNQQSSISRRKVWIARFFIGFAMIFLSFCKFHGHRVIGFNTPNSIVLQPFALLALYWLLVEIKWSMINPPYAFLEYGGKFSYSLYITHPIFYYATPFIINVFIRNSGSKSVNNHGILITVLVFIFAYIFFCFVEKPSHQLARKMSWKLKKK